MVQEGSHLWVQDERLRSYALLSWTWGLVMKRWDLCFSREVHCWCVTRVWNDGLQIHDYIDGFQFKETTWVGFQIISNAHFYNRFLFLICAVHWHLRSMKSKASWSETFKWCVVGMKSKASWSEIFKWRVVGMNSKAFCMNIDN